MKKRETWAIIDIKDIVKNTDVRKVLRCYDFKPWENNELMSLKNNTNLSVNEFRWEQARGTLEITNEEFRDIGIMARDLIDDIKMGFHKIEEDNITYDIANKDSFNEGNFDTKIMNFEYIPYRDYENNYISVIEIYFDNKDVTKETKKAELKELFSYLGLKAGNYKIHR